MKLFMSYASEDRTVAEEIALALREADHEVFFDQSALPPGDAYHLRIQNAIDESDGIVFLISPDSIKEHSYALTELKFAEEKWKHPKGCVLPVIIKKMPIDELPRYLRGVTILEPKGNVEAETLHAIEQWSRPVTAEIELQYDTIRSSLSLAAKLLISGCLAAYAASAVLISAGVLGDDINVPVLNQTNPISLAARFFVLVGFFCGIGYYTLLRRSTKSAKRLEFELGENRRRIEVVLQGSSWITTTTVVRRYLLEGNTAFILMAPGIASTAVPLFGFVVGLPYLAAFANFSFLYLSPTIAWERKFALHWFAFRFSRRFSRYITDDRLLRKFEAKALRTDARPRIDEQLRKYGLLRVNMSDSLGYWVDLNQLTFFSEWKKKREKEQDSGTGDGI